MNIQAMMKQAQKLQKDMLKAKNEIDETKPVINIPSTTVQQNVQAQAKQTPTPVQTPVVAKTPKKYLIYFNLFQLPSVQSILWRISC